MCDRYYFYDLQSNNKSLQIQQQSLFLLSYFFLPKFVLMPYLLSFNLSSFPKRNMISPVNSSNTLLMLSFPFALVYTNFRLYFSANVSPCLRVTLRSYYISVLVATRIISVSALPTSLIWSIQV